MAKTILIKPIISEKTELLSDSLNQYTFVVAKGANKVEIKKAIEETYGVTVDAVNTAIMPAKRKSRFTRTGLQTGRVAAFKKAIVTLPEGEEINLYGDV